ncbi:hypothetical protein CK203_070435 [Vitis vinifera]|uniref:Uncharacterized protein n=1 Tax=Vitis vinifera TaxID=29760 RepID=A0A438FAL4_VITVI|nr:hypothetical protein CK203_070435 [Vitis vinifera]
MGVSDALMSVGVSILLAHQPPPLSLDLNFVGWSGMERSMWGFCSFTPRICYNQAWGMGVKPQVSGLFEFWGKEKFCRHPLPLDIAEEGTFW